MIHKELVDTGVVQEHRVMFCTTQKGRESMIRQLDAELHIESEYQIVQHLKNVLNKFHLIWPEELLEDLSP